MQLFETLSIGDVVFIASITTEQIDVPCPDCQGEKLWTISMPSGISRTIACPRCGGGENNWLHPKRQEHAIKITEATISGVRLEHHPAHAAKSGETQTSIRYATAPYAGDIPQERIYRTRAEAEAAGAAMLEKAVTESRRRWLEDMERSNRRAGLDIVTVLKESADQKYAELDERLDKLRENLLEAVRYPTLYGPKTTKRIYGGDELTGQNLADWLNQQFMKVDLDGWTDEELHEALCSC